MPCRCCQLTKGDNTIKLCYYCKTCKAYICQDCSPDYFLRVKAAGINIVEKAKDVVTKLFN